MASGAILTIDSGIGGLSVFRHIVKALPQHNHIYVADDLGFPYGEKEENILSCHLLEVVTKLVRDYQPALITIACNTASTLVLEPLRARFSIPFVGTVPAIKPAADHSETGLISILATPGTVAREYTQTLIEKHAPHCNVNLVGSFRLAELAEQYFRDDKVDEAAVRDELSPCFIDNGATRRTDTIVLACTHYPFLLPIFERMAPWPVTFIDPACAIAKRVMSVAPMQKGVVQPPFYVTTSGKPFEFVDIY